MQNSNRPRRLIKPFGAAAGSGYIRQVPQDAQTDGTASYATGFPPETFQPVASGGIPPRGQDMNGVLFDATGNAAWSAAGGMALFDNAYCTAIGGYPYLALLTSTTPGVLWQSVVDNNTTDPDSSSAAGWTQVTVGANYADNYYRVPGNIVVQWGTVSYPSSGGPVINTLLYLPYRDAFYNLQVTGFTAGAGNRQDSWVQTIQTGKFPNGFAVQYQNAGVGYPHLDGFEWHTVGRVA